ncbi:hypothetical protein RRG08_043817 [Elysia crispata]|uniref:Uncharacterized protein n=1 Tax=Elysia crispata TaxID=231223 RepID=A0AAE1B6F3_9GAST|nr:hypothetical protein RRG08_043817 [Elysia crispata]
MRLLAAVAAALVCLGHSLARHDAQQACPASKDFSAVAFDALTFAYAVTYDDLSTGIMMYDYKTDNRVLLFNSHTGAVYRRLSDGSCTKFVLAPSNAQGREILSYTDRAGVKRTGIQETVGTLVLKRLLSDNSCFPSFVSADFGNGIDWAYYFTDAKPLTSDGLRHVEETYKSFVDDDCTIQT